MCVDLKVRSKVVKYITGDHYCVNSQTEKQSISRDKFLNTHKAVGNFSQRVDFTISEEKRSEAGGKNVFWFNREMVHCHIRITT